MILIKSKVIGIADLPEGKFIKLACGHIQRRASNEELIKRGFDPKSLRDENDNPTEVTCIECNNFN